MTDLGVSPRTSPKKQAPQSLKAENVVVKSIWDSRFSIFVTPDSDTEVTLHKRVADGVPRLAWILGGVVAVGVGSPVASPPELTGRLLPWRP